MYRVSELTGCCEHGNEPSGSEKAGDFLITWVVIGFSGLCYIEFIS
jgi:hypothetical protein